MQRQIRKNAQVVDSHVSQFPLLDSPFLTRVDLELVAEQRREHLVQGPAIGQG